MTRAAKRAMACAGGRDGGFTLLEVLVAALVAALAVGVLARGAAGGVRAAQVAGRVAEATSRAQSRMAALAGAAAPSPGEASGDDGNGFRFRQAVTAGPRAPGLLLYDLAVTVSWGGDGRGDGNGERAVTLRSRRVAPAPPEAP